MPIVTQQTTEYVLANAFADMDAGRIVANLRWLVDGTDCGLIEVIIQGEEFAAVLGANPAPGKTRGADIADLVYAYCVSKGIVSGTIA